MLVKKLGRKLREEEELLIIVYKRFGGKFTFTNIKAMISCR